MSDCDFGCGPPYSANGPPPVFDAAMRRVRLAMQQRQSRLGIALGTFLDLRLHRRLGYCCGAAYIRERLGISERAARDPEQHLDTFDNREMCARDRLPDQAPDHRNDQLWDIIGRIHVTFVAPLSVSVLLRTVMQGVAGPTEPC